MNRHRLVFAIAAATLLITALFLDRPYAAFAASHHVSPTLRSVAQMMQLPGQFGFTLAVLVAIAVERRKVMRVSCSLLLSAATSGLAVVLIKWAIGRVRPLKGMDPFDLHPYAVYLGGPNLSFPSGHSALAFATFASAFVLRSRYRLLLIAWAIATASARCILGAHYPSDVVAGALVGLMCGAWSTTACVVLISRRHPRPNLVFAFGFLSFPGLHWLATSGRSWLSRQTMWRRSFRPSHHD